MAQIIYCSPTIREQSGILPVIQINNNELLDQTFQSIYHLFGIRTMDNQFSYYFGTCGKEKRSLQDIANRMNDTLKLSGNCSYITVWNEMIELTPYNYTNKNNGMNVAMHIFDRYISEIYLSGERKFQVASNIRYNNITRNALLILTICTSSFTFNGPLNISGSDLCVKSTVLKNIIRYYNETSRDPKCKMQYSQDKIYAYSDYKYTNMTPAIVFN